MTLKSRLAAAAVILATTTVASPALATQILFTGHGVFGPTISTLPPVEYPNASFSFSFELPDTITSNPTSQVTHSRYFLNAAEVSAPITSVTFYPVSGPGALDGGIDLNFAVGGPISLYFADVGSGLTLAPGTYPFTIDSTSSFAGSGTISLNAVPEPASWALMIAGFGLVGVTLRRRAPERAAA